MATDGLPHVCAECTDSTHARVSVTTYDGNELCALCFMKARPERFTQQEIKELEARVIQTEKMMAAQMQQKKTTPTPQKGRWMP